MKHISLTIPSNPPKTAPSRSPQHELAESVEMIKKAGIFDSKHGWGYWLRKVKESGKSSNQMIGILKELESLPAKYSKGARLTNLLK